MDPVEVKRCLEYGINVNQPIDDHGHTVYDLWDEHHIRFQKDAALYSKRSPTHREHRQWEEERYAAVLAVLRQHGAKKKPLKALRVKPNARPGEAQADASSRPTSPQYNQSPNISPTGQQNIGQQNFVSPTAQ